MIDSCDEGDWQDRIGVSAADLAADEGVGRLADGAGATHEGVAAVHL